MTGLVEKLKKQQKAYSDKKKKVEYLDVYTSEQASEYRGRFIPRTIKFTFLRPMSARKTVRTWNWTLRWLMKPVIGKMPTFIIWQ